MAFAEAGKPEKMAERIERHRTSAFARLGSPQPCGGQISGRTARIRTRSAPCDSRRGSARLNALNKYSPR